MNRTPDKIPEREWTVELSLFTKDGKPILIKYKADVEHPNRGFITDKLEAYVDGELAGYLKIENVPFESLEKFYPSGPINYAAQIMGECDLLPYERDTADLKTCDLDTLNHVVAFFHRRSFTPSKARVENRAEFEDMFKKQIRKTSPYIRMDKAYRNFVDYRVDKPIVQFSNTEDPTQTFDPDRNFSGRGIGKALYIAAALELDTQGLTLRKSTLCSESAMALWNSLERDGLVRAGEAGRLEIDPQAVRDTYRLWPASETEWKMPSL